MCTWNFHNIFRVFYCNYITLQDLWGFSLICDYTVLVYFVFFSQTMQLSMKFSKLLKKFCFYWISLHFYYIFNSCWDLFQLSCFTFGCISLFIHVPFVLFHICWLGMCCWMDLMDYAFNSTILEAEIDLWISGNFSDLHREFQHRQVYA